MEENSSVPTGFLFVTAHSLLLFLFFLWQDLADQCRFHSLILHFFHMNIQSVDLHIKLAAVRRNDPQAAEDHAAQRVIIDILRQIQIQCFRNVLNICAA